MQRKFLARYSILTVGDTAELEGSEPIEVYKMQSFLDAPSPDRQTERYSLTSKSTSWSVARLKSDLVAAGAQWRLEQQDKRRGQFVLGTSQQE